MEKILDSAIQTAVTAFAGREREGEPDILHTMRVVDNVYRNLGGDLSRPFVRNAMVVAALHDVLEDTNTDEAALRKQGYPEYIICAVKLLTRPKSNLRDPVEIDREYLEYIRQIRDSCDRFAIAVKLADLQDNTDPVRTARMQRNQPQRYERLQKRYALAKDILGGAVD
jgi:(p)ppGpp synthase/HD superfamily hydrolase